MYENKVIITAALSGGGTPYEKNNAIPVTPKQIAEDAYRCWNAGASVVHLHMRNDDGTPTHDPSRFKETIDLIRAYEDCDVIINCTSSAPLSNEERVAHFMAYSDKIEMGSFDAGTMNFNCEFVFENKPDFLEYLGKLYQDKNIKAEVEVFDMGMLSNVEYYIKNGVLQTPIHYQFVLGALGGMSATVEHLAILKNSIPKGSTWSAFGIGVGHMPVLYGALALGGHIRVGLEDNVYFSRGIKATNLQLVERAAQAVTLFGKEVANAKEARTILGIPQLK